MRIVVAMSGGVDSSTVAALLKEQGHEVIGVHMKLHDAGPAGDARRCCGYDDALDARAVADRLEIPFYVANLRDAFNKAVISDFVEEYRRGRTPNPCVQCNGVIKFRALLGRALSLGADRLATGHYARIEGGQLRSAVDVAKDQTYFLWPMPPAALEKTLFPLGGMRKAEVRAHAARLGLAVAEKPESQEVCFVPDDDHARLVREHHPDLDASGPIVDDTGREIGRHDGYFRYTIGQRRGLNVAIGKPTYVTAVDPASRTVVVGSDAQLVRHGLIASGASWFARPAPADRVLARVRHRGALVPCTVGSGDPLEVRFLTPVRAVAPGQSIVFYSADGETVLGGAVIDRAVDPAAQATA